MLSCKSKVRTMAALFQDATRALLLKSLSSFPPVSQTPNVKAIDDRYSGIAELWVFTGARFSEEHVKN